MWFTEDAWSPIILCVVIGAIFFIGYVQTQRAKFLYPLGVMVFVAITIFFVELAIVTDLEKVDGRLKELITTFVEESQNTKTGVTPANVRCYDFFTTENTIDRARVARAIGVVNVANDVRVPSIETKLSAEDTRAVTEFRVNGSVSTAATASRRFATRWRVHWQKVGSEWKISETHMLDLINDEELRIPRVD
jgi:low affinity Fe/Cu permease